MPSRNHSIPVISFYAEKKVKHTDYCLDTITGAIVPQSGTSQPDNTLRCNSFSSYPHPQLIHLLVNITLNDHRLPTEFSHPARLLPTSSFKMTDATTATYTPLPTPTSIRILVLAPALPSSPEINCYLLPSDLNSDHNLFPETSPRPIKSLSVMYTSPPLPGKPNEFIVWTDTTPTQPRKMHPFQRYSALSYVWGDPSDPVYINLDGRQVPITRNLYAALRAVRKLQAGKRLWVDALCIDQSDCEEKRVQIGLMRRVYEQAKRVVAFVPLEKGDGGRVVELVGRVCRAERLLRAEMEGGDSQYDEDDEDDEDGEDGEDGEDHTFKVVPQTDDLELQLQQLGLADPGPTKFLEKFGLPTVDSPLWVSWRRFFASPYFQRIWILQEFLSAKKVRFHFGDARLDASAVIVACYAIKEYSEVDNRAYMQRRGEELADSGQPHRGLKRAWLMFEKRVIWKKCRAALAELIVLAGQFFMATDLRDKVYALIGLAKDGQEYMGHVSYEPSETHIKVFTRFARLLIENGYAEELLRCSGISGSADRDPELPTWVPVRDIIYILHIVLCWVEADHNPTELGRHIAFS